MKKASISVLLSAEAPVSFKGYRFPPDVISYAVCFWSQINLLSVGMVCEENARNWS